MLYPLIQKYLKGSSVGLGLLDMAVQVVPPSGVYISGGGGPETAPCSTHQARLHPTGSSLKGPYATGFPVLGSGHKGLYGSLKSGSQVGKMILEIIIENTSTIREDQYFKNTDEGGSERTQTGEGQWGT